MDGIPLALDQDGRAHGHGPRPLAHVAWATSPSDRETYLAGRLWPHLVVDDAFDRALVRRAARDIAQLAPSAFEWQRTHRIQKASLVDLGQAGEAVRALWAQLHEEAFLARLGELTAVPGLTPDPDLHFAGVFLTPPGGWQRVHEDFPTHPVTGLWNRVVVLLYLSEWRPGDGGELELWPEDMASAPTVIEPHAGRMVIFETSSRTRHGIGRVSTESASRIALGARFYSTEPPAVPPRSVYRRTVRRPGETLLDVLPGFEEVRDHYVDLVARLCQTRRGDSGHPSS
jgi:hypothetical protein